MTKAPDDDRREELARLHDALAAAQDRSYWLDRWQLDLNSLMQRRGASELRTAIRALRAVYRALYDASHWLRGGMRALPERAAQARRVVGEERSRAGTATISVGATASPRLRAAPVTALVGERVGGDDPQALVALQRADMLVDALGAAGGSAEPEQRWLGMGTGADAVLEVLADAFPGLQASDNGAVDVAFAISGWGAPEEPLERLDELRDVVRPGGRLLLVTDAGPGAGVSPERLLAHCTPEWRVALYRPGGMEGGRDLYVLERA